MPQEKHIHQLPKISFLAYLVGFTNKIVVGKGLPWKYQPFLFSLNSYGELLYDDFVPQNEKGHPRITLRERR